MPLVTRARSGVPRIAAVILISLLSAGLTAVAGEIEAVPGKHYGLTKRHGPWMIMVASFHAASPDGIVRDGKTPQQIADELVFELRQKKIPAYTFMMDAVDDEVDTVDRLGRDEVRVPLTQINHVSVIAGNYSSFEDPVAQKTLVYIKKYQPECLQQPGVKYLRTRRRQGPLGAAFLTVNPLLTPEEIQQRQHDPLLVKLNSNGKYSLYQNKGEYSLVVATFSGKKMAHLGDSNSPDALEAFRIDVQDNDLDQASTSAWELAVAMRERENIDAYVWHDRYQSVVTVGSFEAQNDPKLKRYLQVFAPSPVTQVAAGGDQVVFPGAPSRNFGVAASGGYKIYAVTGFGKKGDENRLWAFDPTPMLMRVPQVR
jgi:hypothetical protein